MINVTCPHCNAGISCDDRYAGRVVLCPTCKKQLQMPAVAQALPAHPRPPVPTAQPPEQEDELSWLSGGSSSTGTSSRTGPRSYIPKKNKKSDPTLFIVGGVIGIVVLVGIGLFASGVFTTPNGQSGQQAPGAPKPTDRTVVAKGADVHPTAVAGELFVTTQGGDVKKAAGQKICFTPVTPELQKKVAAMLSKANQSMEQWERAYKECSAMFEADPEYSHTLLGSLNERFDQKYGPRLREPSNTLRTVLDSSQSVFLAGATSVVTDSDGKFRIDLPPGKYVLWTTARSMGLQSFSWKKLVDVQGASANLILSEDSVFIYADSEDKHRLIRESKCMHRLLREIADEIGVR